MSVGLAPPATPVWVRLAALTVASELIGVAAHASNGGGLPQPGAWLVITMLVAGLVGGLLVAARSVRRRLGHGGPAAHLEDLAAVAALVLGQWVVHWQVMPVSPALGMAMPSAHLQHTGVPVGAGMAHHAGTASGTGVGMLLGHAAAAVLVALLLRWLETAVLACVHVLATHRLPVRSAWLLLQRAATTTVLSSTGSTGGRGLPDAGVGLVPRLCEFLHPVVRRGPPAAAWS
jgi:hypothetical protein